ncbi:MAG: hypothetical protein GC160_20645 [Acidobacteria bacterium]|nr:hypothetical protein [Acidobacteriota bacterium]
MKRVLTALLLIPLVVVLIFWAPPLAVRLALAAVALLCLHECYAIIRAGGVRPFQPLGYALGAVLIVTSQPVDALLIVAVVAMLLLTLQSERHEAALAVASSTLFAVAYTCGPFALARWAHEVNPHWMFVVLLINWAGDSAALYVGQALGRRKLAPTISPNKTWEGSIASALLGGGVGVAYLHSFVPALHPLVAVAAALWINVAGQAGDLAESVLKRGAHVKDSGSLLPGHGGMLDRMDGALFGYPALYVFLEVLRRLA